ncbi:hypothetical protein KJ885_01695 [Patescibacteria group bacterium]|nr:hypothetical protein [Patescibacteria group bacterium]
MGAYRDPNEPHIERLMATLQNVAPEKREEVIAQAMARLEDLPFGEARQQQVLPDTQIFQRMLEACKFDWVNDNITQENFSILEEPNENTEYVLVDMGKPVSTEEAEAEIKKQGLPLTTLADLLLYVRKNPDKQKEFPIVALGSRWQHSSGRWFSPYAACWGSWRRLRLCWRERDWNDRCRFLARKR